METNNALITQQANQMPMLQLSQKDLQTLVQAGIIPKDTPQEQVSVFAKVCSEKMLSPFSKQIHLIARWDGKNNMNRYTIQTAVDGFRSLADRTGTYAGSDDYLFDEGLSMYEMIKNKRQTPTTATATVYKIVQGLRVPFTVSARWSEYYPGEKMGFMWNKMPFLMLGKCAEALALRKAFPEQLTGIYSNEEMAQADITEIPVKKNEVKPEVKIENIETVEAVSVSATFLNYKKEIESCINIEDLKTTYVKIGKDRNFKTLPQNEIDDLVKIKDTKKAELTKAEEQQ